MKRIFFTACAVAALAAGSAGAADLPVRVSTQTQPRAGCAQFGGLYIGGNAGWGYYDHRWNDRDGWSGTNDDDLHRSNVNASKSGFLGGVQGGYNFQMNCTVFGIEADYAWGNIKNNTLETDGEIGAALDTLSIQSRLRGLGSVRLRSGLVVDNLLLYVTGGLAFADFQRTYTQTDVGLATTETFQHNSTRWGWAAGFGTEWAINNNWSIKSEVLYSRFESDQVSFTCSAAFTCGLPGAAKRFDNQDSVWVTRLGVNYRFGG